jgi:hypothetical protein
MERAEDPGSRNLKELKPPDRLCRFAKLPSAFRPAVSFYFLS